MKKLLALLLAAATLFAAAACQRRAEIPEPPAPETTSPQTTPEETPAESPEGTAPTSGDKKGTVGEVYTDTIMLEGMAETVSYARVNGTFDYTMPMDVDRFEYAPTEEKDYFICALNEHVWMSVEHFQTATWEEVREKLPEWPDEAIVSENDMTLTENKYETRHVHVVYGTSPDSAVLDYYIVRDNSGGCYLITHCYFLEGAEGWGARMTYMAEGFRIEKA